MREPSADVIRVVRALVHRDLLDELQRLELDDGDGVLAAHRDIGEPAVLRQRHLVRILADVDLVHDGALAHVHDLEIARAIAREIHLRPVG